MNRFREFEFSKDEKEVLSEPFKKPLIGEKLTYNVYWTGILVGKFILHVKEKEKFKGNEVFHVVAEAYSNKLFSLIYKTKDTLHSYIDSKMLFSHGYELVRQGWDKEKIEVFYDYKKLKANINTTENGKEIMNIPDRIQDTISCIYYLRTQDIKVGDEIILDVNVDKKNWGLEYKIKKFGKSNIGGLGKFNTFLITPKIKDNGKYVDDRKIKLWMSSNEKRVPLLFDIDVPLGYIRVILQKVEKEI